LNCCRFSIGIAAVVFLVALRIATGWHFFDQGIDHYHDPNWSSEGFLRQARGPWADFYRSKVPDFHGFDELIAHPWREVETKRETPKATDPNAQPTEKKKAAQTDPPEGPALVKADDKTALAANAPTEGTPQPSDADAKKPPETATAANDSKPTPPTEGEPTPSTKKQDQTTKRAQEKLAEELAVARPIYDDFAQRVIKDWSDRRHEIASHYDFDDAQRQQAAAVFERYKQGLLNYLASIENDLYLYQRELRRLDAMRSFQGASDIPFASKRVADKQREVANQPSAWLADFRTMERELHEDIAAIATEKQKEAGLPPQSESPLKRNDRILVWAMMICGGCLIVGLFTRIAAVACAAFLFLVIMSQPPWVPGTMTALFPYQLIEMISLLTLATTAVGRWGGLDFFLHFLITAPFRGRR
jgi:uncharacterized membrane protein YphA (DoxX/SURF4 family)